MNTDWNKKITTRDGRTAQVLTRTSRVDPAFPVIALVDNSDGSQRVEHFTAAGKFFTEQDSALDLVNPTTKIKRWVAFTKLQHAVAGDGYTVTAYHRDPRLNHLSGVMSCDIVHEIEVEVPA